MWENAVAHAELGNNKHSEIRHPYLYILEVSRDGHDWTTVIDHSICKCYFTQELYFPRHSVQYV